MAPGLTKIEGLAYIETLFVLYSYAGEALKREFGLELGRITGLDPADPHFEETDPIIRLDETDAFYVDAIHTDANPVLSGFI